jgi:phosphoenolpyruvate-protein kinase (PTS system EI component)
MVIKEELLISDSIDSGRYGETINNLANESPRYKQAMAEAQERLKHLIAELEAVLDGEQKKIRSFPG